MATEREQFVRSNIDLRRQAIADGINVENKDRMEQEIREFEKELQTILEQEDQRQQRKAEIIDDINLPYDYDQLFGQKGINEEMENIIKQVKEQCFAFSESETQDLENVIRGLRQLNSDQQNETQRLREESSADQGLIISLKDELTQEQEAHRVTSGLLIETKAKLYEETNLRTDAEAKRDAAVREAESAKADLQEIQQKTQKPQTGSKFELKLSSSLANKTQLQAALERWELPPIEMPKEEQFREQVTETESADHSIPAPPEVTFRDDAQIAVEDSGAGDHTANDETWEASVERRLAELKRAVDVVRGREVAV